MLAAQERTEDVKSLATLVIGRHEVTNPFQLVGADEDSIRTYLIIISHINVMP